MIGDITTGLSGIYNFIESTFNFFQTIVDYIGSAFMYLVSYVRDVLYVVELLVFARGTVIEFFYWLPSVCITLFSATLTVIIAYKLIGREG